jgi:mRNA interferase HigB
MKVHLIKIQSIERFVFENAQSKRPFEIWLSIIKLASWTNPKDIVTTFNSADILGKSSNRVVFNIGGNKYRIICQYYFGKQRVHLFVKWVGTHAEYTKLCNNKEQYSADAFKSKN